MREALTRRWYPIREASHHRRAASYPDHPLPPGGAMTEPYDHLLKAYARLVIRLGVNVQPGQPVVIRGVPEQAAVARALAEEAYRVGASRVTIDYEDPYLQRDQVRFAPEDEL